MKNKSELIVEIISFLYILLFVYAAASKLMDYERFQFQLWQSPLLTAFSTWVAWGIPAIEIIIAIMLTTKRFRLVALYASFSLMTMFTFYIMSILEFGEYIPCSCGGILGKLGWTQHLFFNVGFVLLAVIAILILSKERKDPDLVTT